MEYIDIWRDRYIRGYEKLVLIYLVENYKVEYGYSYPTRKQIEVDIGIAKDTLSKVLNSLEEKGYITRATNPNKGGRNNIYYIHKYLVASKKEVNLNVQDMNIKEVPEEVKPKLDEAPEAPADVKPEVEASTNELLVNENCKLTKKLTKDDIVDINKMDTDKLLQAINQVNKKQGNNAYHINYIKTTYRNIQNNPPATPREVLNENSSNVSNNRKKDNRKPISNWDGAFNEHFRKYTPEELEERLLRMQSMKKLRG